MRKLFARAALPGLALIVLASAILLHPAQPAPVSPERTLNVMPESETHSSAIPPLDADAPARTETATFALG